MRIEPRMDDCGLQVLMSKANYPSEKGHHFNPKNQSRMYSLSSGTEYYIITKTINTSVLHHYLYWWSLIIRSDHIRKCEMFGVW